MLCIQGLISWPKTTGTQDRLLPEEPKQEVKGFTKNQKHRAISFYPKTPASCCNQLGSGQSRTSHLLSGLHFLSVASSQPLSPAQVQQGRAEQTSAQHPTISLPREGFSSQSKGTPALLNSTSMKQKPACWTRIFPEFLGFDGFSVSAEWTQLFMGYWINHISYWLMINFHLYNAL